MGAAHPKECQDQGQDDPEAVNLLLRQETQSLMALLLQVLQPFPEVRAAVADALTRSETDETA